MNGRLSGIQKIVRRLAGFSACTAKCVYPTKLRQDIIRQCLDHLLDEEEMSTVQLTLHLWSQIQIANKEIFHDYSTFLRMLRTEENRRKWDRLNQEERSAFGQTFATFQSSKMLANYRWGWNKTKNDRKTSLRMIERDALKFANRLEPRKGK